MNARAESLRPTLIGMSAVLMWSASIGLLRSVAEIFGATAGGALIFSCSALLASLVFGLRVRGLAPAYLWLCGALFVFYEVALALSVGLAHSRAQSLELGMINYLWPSLTVLFAVLSRQQRGSWLLLPALGLCLIGIGWVVKGEQAWSVALFWHNVQSNPVAYALALLAALTWAGYSLAARRWGGGGNAVPLFLLASAGVLWLKYLLGDDAALRWHAGGAAQVLLLGALTATAYSCWNHGVQRGNLTLLASASYFTPVLSMLLASLWLDLHPGLALLGGAALVTAGSLLCWWATRQRSAR